MTRPQLPAPRGPVSACVLDRLDGSRAALGSWSDDVDVLGDDAQLALTCCYELHYAGFAGVDDELEWAPDLIAGRRRLERAFLRRVADEVGPVVTSDGDVLAELRSIARDATGPSLSRWMEEQGSQEHMREFCIHRSEYQRKEADPHTWMIPRLAGRAKAAVVTIQYDEYGAGRAEAVHAELFADTMRELGLDPRYGAYRDVLPGVTLATGNLVTMLGLHRRLRAACAGHLALFEMTSVGPMGRYARTLARLGFGAAAQRFYTEHVVADARHEQVAQEELVAGMLELEPGCGRDIVFGARALALVERRMAQHLLDAWAHDETSLLQPALV
jgi:hypothetical protein